VYIFKHVLTRRSQNFHRYKPDNKRAFMNPLPEKAVLFRLYRTMLTIRMVEEQLARSYLAGLVHGACHTYVGEEAVASGVCAHLRDDDAVFSTHRGHGHALAKGVSPAALIAELYGRVTGCSFGRGGSMHLFAPEIGMMGTSGIVGPCILQAAGAGYTAKLLGNDRVGVAFFGDGAVNNGAFHEGVNLAAIYDLPAIFVCENNLYATEVAFSYASRNPSVASRAAAYGIPGVEVDGNDGLAVYHASGEAISRARQGGGPTLIECKTYRTRAHAEGMRDAGYRTQEEIEAWKQRDPIRLLRSTIIERLAGSESDIEALEADIRKTVDEAHAFAADSPWPDPETVTHHVFYQAEK
jgi:2-oxoisovalerate dehydrogenase E1 component